MLTSTANTNDLKPTIAELATMGVLDVDMLAALHATQQPGWSDLTRLDLARRAGNGFLTVEAIATYGSYFGQAWEDEAIQALVDEDAAVIRSRAQVAQLEEQLERDIADLKPNDLERAP